MRYVKICVCWMKCCSFGADSTNRGSNFKWKRALRFATWLMYLSRPVFSLYGIRQVNSWLVEIMNFHHSSCFGMTTLKDGWKHISKKSNLLILPSLDSCIHKSLCAPKVTQCSWTNALKRSSQPSHCRFYRLLLALEPVPKQLSIKASEHKRQHHGATCHPFRCALAVLRWLALLYQAHFWIYYLHSLSLVGKWHGLRCSNW